MTLVQRQWKRQVIHRVIHAAMYPIEAVMKSGIVMDCADGKQRLCFPVLCQHIGDMEEQWMLTLTISPMCPKCHHRERGDDGDDLEMEWSADGGLLNDSSRQRTDYDACQCHSRSTRDLSYPLKR